MKICNGNIFHSDGAITVPVNTVGVMGAGLAKAALAYEPMMLDDYRLWCANGALSVGHPKIWQSANHIFILFPTKRHWRGNSQYAWITQGMSKLVKLLPNQKINTVAIPKLGCGLGGLKWVYVKPIIEEYAEKLERLNIDVEIYE